MPFCSNCGAAVPPNARFCSGCGQATAAGAAPAPSSPASYSPSSSSNVSSITGVAQQGASVSNAYLMGGLGKGADVNTELSRILGDTSTQRQWSTETRGPQQSLGTCVACRSPIQSESIQALGGVWHTGCFKCGGTCGELFAKTGNNRVLEKDGKPYCENCYDAKFGEQCAAGCGRGLGPQRVKALGSLWHPDCFRCTACKAKFEGSGVINRGGKPYCKTCSAK